MKNIGLYTSCILLAGLFPLASLAAEESSGKPVTVGNPAEAAQLPAALQAAYSGGARDITIAPGTYVIPATGRSAIALVEWKDVRIAARGVSLVFEELAHRPFCLQRCEGVTLEGAVLRFASPAFTQGRIVTRGHDDRGDFLDWQIDAGFPVGLDPTKSTFDVADQKTRRIKAGTGDVGVRECESLGDRRFRLRSINGLLGSAAAGDWLFTRVTPCEPVVHLEGSSRCTMREVTLQNAGFAAFFETSGDGGHVYIGCKVAPGPKPAGATEDPLVGRDAEVDFLLQHGSKIYPIEAKSGTNVRAKSLAFYLAKYDPSLAVRTSLRNLKIDGRVLNIPLYAFQSLPRFLALAAL